MIVTNSADGEVVKRALHEQGYDAIDPKNKARVDDIEFRLSDGRLFFMPFNERGPMVVAPDQTAMVIIFLSGTAILYGENLAQISRAISKRSIEYVEEFDSALHERPSELGAPIVTRIEIRTKKPLEELAQIPEPESQPVVRLAKH